jgi:cytochrome bd-type quinol oxidase subunit 1
MKVWLPLRFSLELAFGLVLNLTLLGLGIYLKKNSERWRSAGKILQVLCLLGLGMFVVSGTLMFLLSPRL